MINTLTLKFSAALIALSILVSACVPLVIGGAAATGTVLHDRRDATVIWDDQAIDFAIKNAMRSCDQMDLRSNVRVIVVSYNQNVLLIGQVPSVESKQRIEQIAEGTEDVKQVYNELEIGEPISLSTRSNDSWITTKIKTSSTFHKEIDPLRTKVVTENGVVYLLGIVTRHEADALTDQARKTSGVKRVVRVFEYID